MNKCRVNRKLAEQVVKVLKEEDGKNSDEMAAILDVSVGSVSSCMSTMQRCMGLLTWKGKRNNKRVYYLANKKTEAANDAVKRRRYVAKFIGGPDDGAQIHTTHALPDTIPWGADLYVKIATSSGLRTADGIVINCAFEHHKICHTIDDGTPRVFYKSNVS